MNRRLQQFLRAENISQSQFADTIGVARASVSHILAGRNKPGFDFLLAMSKHYPSLNLEWLITGKGRMYLGASPLPEAEQNPVHQELEQKELFEYPAEDSKIEQQSLIPEKKSKEIKSSTQRNIKKIIILYDDDSYQELI